MPRDAQELPRGWSWSTLGEVTRVNLRRSAIRELPDSTPVSFIPMAAVDAEFGIISAPEKRTLGQVRKGFTSFCDGDVIMAKITPSMENGKAAVARGLINGTGFGSTEFHVLTPTKAVMPEYVFHFVRQEGFRRDAKSNFAGTAGQLRVPSAFLGDYPFPLAPLPEQRRIVAKIEELFSRLDAGVAALKRVRAALKRYKASVLKAACEGRLVPQDPSDEPADVLLARILAERRVKWEADLRAKGKDPRKAKYDEPEKLDIDSLRTLPEGWRWASVSEVGNVQLGRQRTPKHHHGPHMRPYLRVANVFEDRIDTTDILEMNFTPSEYEVYKLKLGDILLNEGQSPELLGRPAMYRDEVPGACFQNTLIRFQANKAASPQYALTVFRSHLHSGRFAREATITTNIAHLSGGRFSRVEFPLPPRAEQDRIVAELERRLSVVAQLQQTITLAFVRAARLRQSILSQAFSGQLVPHDPADEPADRLLAQIQVGRGEEPEARAAKPGRRKAGASA